MTKEDKKILDEQDYQTLAKWYCDINCSRLVKELPNSEEVNVKIDKPMIDWTEEDSRRFRESRSLSIMAYIQSVVGERATSREWNKDRMNEEEFEDFWNGMCGDNKAQRRHEIRGLKNIATQHNIDHKLVDWNKSEEDIFEQLDNLSND